jgi:AAA domain
VMYRPPEDLPVKGENTSRKRPRLEARRLDVGRLLDLPETPLPWRCDRLAADGYVTVLTGEGGEGKSLLTLALAKAVAVGSSAAGIECGAGRAVIFDAENGERLLARRLKAAGVPRRGIEVYDADMFDIRSDVEQFAEVVGRERANFVVLDSLRILAPGSKESEADDMAPVMTAVRRLARTTEAAIVVVHHRGKGENASDYRGSSVIRDQADMLFVLSRSKSDPESSTRRFLKASKCRIDTEPETRWLRVVRTAATGGISVEPADPFGEADAGAIPLAKRALADELRPHLSDKPRSRAELARAASRDANDGTVRRALQLLADEGVARQVNRGWIAVSQPATSPGNGWMADGGTDATLGEAR